MASNRERIDQILREGQQVPVPVGKATPVPPETQPETRPAPDDGKDRYQAFTDCEATATNHAAKEDDRDKMDFDIFTPDCVYDNPYTTYLGSRYIPEKETLHVMLTTGQYIIQGRNLWPIRKALKRRTLLTITQFDMNRHTMPKGNETLVTKIEVRGELV